MIIDIGRTPYWLGWHSDHRDALVELKHDYLSTVAVGLGAMIAGSPHPGFTGAPLVDEWEALPDESMDRILASPATSFEVFHPRHAAAQFDDFIAVSIAAENRRNGARDVGATRDCWSASGDFTAKGTDRKSYVLPSQPQTSWQAPSLGRSLFVDFRSPHALSISLDGEFDQLSKVALEEACTSGSIPRFSDDEEEVIRDNLESALDGIRAASAHVAWFVENFTLALVVRRDQDFPTRFSSGTSGQFIGRTCLVNPLAPRVDISLLADALVHESIHSVLSMQERADAWVDDADVYSGIGWQATSPWTGNSLTPRQFMQACFVWFGLYNFWRTVDASNTFSPGEVAKRRAVAREGFYKQPLCDLMTWQAHTNPRLLKTIEALQLCVLREDFPVGADTS